MITAVGLNFFHFTSPFSIGDLLYTPRHIVFSSVTMN